VAVGTSEDVIRLAGLSAGQTDGRPFVGVIADFHLTNPIARASKTMATCSRLRAGQLAAAAE
jgi:NADH-quinone oxidoreductase subunit G